MNEAEKHMNEKEEIQEIREINKLYNGSDVDESQNEDQKAGETGNINKTTENEQYGIKIQELQEKLDSKCKQSDEYLDMLQRKLAEFENYKKRTMKEKQSICSDTTAEVIAAFIPVLDNIERALEVAGKQENSPLKEGVEMIYKQIKEIFNGFDITHIETIGDEFNPEYHNAIMHIEDEKYGENIIIEEFQKGYMMGDKVIRHSIVKVAN